MHPTEDRVLRTLLEKAKIDTVSPFRNISMIPNTFTKFKREDFLRTPICSNVDWVKHKETYTDVTAAICLLYRVYTATSYQS